MIPLNDAQRDLAAANEMLARSVARTRARRIVAMSYDELLSAAFLGLCRASRDFVPTRGTFAAYACCCMHRQINRELETILRVAAKICIEPGDVGLISGGLDDHVGDVDVRDFLSSLPALDRRVLEAHLTGLFFREIAVVEGITKQQAHRLAMNVRNYLP